MGQRLALRILLWVCAGAAYAAVLATMSSPYPPICASEPTPGGLLWIIGLFAAGVLLVAATLVTGTSRKVAWSLGIASAAGLFVVIFAIANGRCPYS